MEKHFRVSQVAPLFVTLMALFACKKSGPKTVIASCDLRGIEGSSTCWDIYDKGFAPRVQTICMDADLSGTRWKDGAACNQGGSLGGCQSDYTTTWHFPSTKTPTTADVQKACTDKEKFVPSTGASVAVPPPVRSAPTTKVGGRKVCLNEGKTSCQEYEDATESAKKSCDDYKGTWTFDCPTENLVGTCKSKYFTTKYYKPTYFDANDAKRMCNMADDVFTAAP